MISYILKNNIYVMAALAVAVLIYLAVDWASLTVLQRMSRWPFRGRLTEWSIHPPARRPQGIWHDAAPA